MRLEISNSAVYFLFFSCHYFSFQFFYFRFLFLTKYNRNFEAQEQCNRLPEKIHLNMVPGEHREFVDESCLPERANTTGFGEVNNYYNTLNHKNLPPAPRTVVPHTIHNNTNFSQRRQLEGGESFVIEGEGDPEPTAVYSLGKYLNTLGEVKGATPTSGFSAVHE